MILARRLILSWVGSVALVSFAALSPASATAFCNLKKTPDGFVALRGGPGGNTRLAGAYSGVFTQTPAGSDIGLFLLNATTQGASVGQIVVFSNSNAGSFFYSGTLTGLASSYVVCQLKSYLGTFRIASRLPSG